MCVCECVVHVCMFVCVLRRCTSALFVMYQSLIPPTTLKPYGVFCRGNDKSATSLSKEKEKSKEKPEIDYFDFSSK